MSTPKIVWQDTNDSLKDAGRGLFHVNRCWKQADETGPSNSIENRRPRARVNECYRDFSSTDKEPQRLGRGLLARLHCNPLLHCSIGSLG
jgi:hypothetical protein